MGLSDRQFRGLRRCIRNEGGLELDGHLFDRRARSEGYVICVDARSGYRCRKMLKEELTVWKELRIVLE